MADPSDGARAGGQDAQSTARANTQSRLRSRRPAPSPRLAESPAAARSPMPRRRASMLSLGSDISVESLRSTTDDLFLPRAGRYGKRPHDDDHPGETENSSHLHSLPMMLAIVPAVVGIFFQNGSAVMTDLTLLAIGTIFLNWTIRIPWSWYHSAQAVRQRDSISTEDYLPQSDDDDTILEEEDDDGTQGKDHGSGDEARKDVDADSKSKGASNEPARQRPRLSAKSRASPEQLSAAVQLRWLELLALLACFLAPVAGAGLLHAIREQLSRPSEGLVSNYNLTIFVLAAEIRPLSHVIKLVENRALYLQRVVAQNPYRSRGDGGGIPASNEALAALAARIAAMESQGMQQKAHEESPGGFPTSTNPAVSREQLVADTRRAMQPDIDALNRAVRRYEKRATILSIQIDGRLSALENKVADAIALAAAAERSATGTRRGSAATLANWLAGCVVVPVRAAAWLVRKILELPAAVWRWIIGLFYEVLGMVKGQKEGKESKEARKRSDARLRAKIRDAETLKPKVRRSA